MKISLIDNTDKNMIIGYFDYIEKGYAMGWAYSTNSSNEPITIEIICNDETVGSGIANNFREDLKSAGIGDGSHAFKIKLSYELYNNKEHLLFARETKFGRTLEGGLLSTGRLDNDKDYVLLSRPDAIGLLKKMLKKSQFKAAAKKQDGLIQAYKIAALLQETGELIESNKAWIIIEKVLGKNALTTYKKGEAALLKGDFSQAIDYFNNALILDPEFYWAHCGIANVSMLLGRYQEAEQSFKKASILVPLHDLSKHHAVTAPEMETLAKARKHTNDKNHKEALNLLQAELVNNPSSSTLEKRLVDLSTPLNNIFLPESETINRSIIRRKTLELILNKVDIFLKQEN